MRCLYRCLLCSYNVAYQLLLWYYMLRHSLCSVKKILFWLKFRWILAIVAIHWKLSHSVTPLDCIIRPRRSRSVAAYSRQTFPWTICRSVRASVRASVCPVHCGKTADRIRIPFGIIGRTGPGMRQIVGFGDRSTGRDTFGGEFGARHCNQWGLYGARVRQRRDAALFPSYFGQTC